MPFERWGSLSVSDHVDTAALVANVLLYDRLVVPVMTEQADRDERAYWLAHGWDPDLQAKRLDELEALAIRRPWDAARRDLFKTRVAELAAEQADVDHYAWTRRILAQEQVVERLPGVDHVTVIAAYNSMNALSRDFNLADAPDPLAAQACLLTRRLAMPATADVEKALKLAIALSKDAEFRAKRAALFDWQQDAAARGIPPQAIVSHLARMTDEYNAEVKKAARNVYWKLAFTVCGVGLGFATGDVAGATASAALSAVQFAMFDRKPVIEAGNREPAAMFHDIETRVGLRLSVG